MSLKFVLLLPILWALVLFFSIHLLWGVFWLLGKCLHFSVSYTPWKWTAIGLVLLSWSVIAYGYFVGRFRLDVNRVEFAHTEVPSAFDGYRIVHISDLHLSTFNDRPKALERFVDSVNAQHPDLICFTGDLVTIGKEEAVPFTTVLKKMKAKDGVMAVLGNHDFLIYRRDFANNAARMRAVEELADYMRDDLGWCLLRNENRLIAREKDTLCVLGVDNHSCSDQGFHTVAYGDLSKAMADASGFKILLSHDPTHWRSEVLPQTDIPLTLSGHTHDAQLRLFGWSPASRMFPEHAGLYSADGEYGEQFLYVNVGTGCTFPVRVGVDAEITVIELKRVKS